MPRYFIELSYRGSKYSGFQVQENAVTVQSEVEKAFAILHRRSVALTGSSRTDAGVHAFQNFFHFDDEEPVNVQFIYKMNAILPDDIVIRNIYPVSQESHSRFDATSRAYIYKIHRFKDPFLKGLSCYYPYQLNLEAMEEAASWVKEQNNFFAFCKTNTQVKNFNCTILKSEWEKDGRELYYNIEGNRFLRGMVRLLTATLLKVGRGKVGLEEFKTYFTEEKKCGFSVPAHGLYLNRVSYPENYFPAMGGHFTVF